MQFFVRRAITITVASFGFQTDKVVGQERPRSAAEYAGNTRHCEDAVALPIVVAIDGSSIYSPTKGANTHRTFYYNRFIWTQGPGRFRVHQIIAYGLPPGLSPNYSPRWISLRLAALDYAKFLQPATLHLTFVV